MEYFEFHQDKYQYTNFIKIQTFTITKELRIILKNKYPFMLQFYLDLLLQSYKELQVVKTIISNAHIFQPNIMLLSIFSSPVKIQ